MSSLLVLVGWYTLPGYVTSFLQSVYYGITIRAGDPRPLPQTPRFERHRRRIYIFVIVSYLLYTLYETFHQVQVSGSFYTLLGVTPYDTDRTIQSQFRRMAARHHPDKAGDNQVAAAYFLVLRHAQETLLDPVKRFAYDRFGPSALNWGPLGSKQDILRVSLLRLVLPQYLLTLGVMVLMNWIWWGSWGRYWRFWYFAALLTLELVLITRPQASFMPSAYLPDAISAWLPFQSFHLLPFQLLTLARSVSLTLSIFITKVSPPDDPSVKSETSIPGPMIQRMVQLVHSARETDIEATRALQLAQAPFRGDRESIPVLRRGMQETLVLAGVRSGEEVQRAVAEVIQRRNASD